MLHFSSDAAAVKPWAGSILTFNEFAGSRHDDDEDDDEDDDDVVSADGNIKSVVESISGSIEIILVSINTWAIEGGGAVLASASVAISGRSQRSLSVVLSHSM